MQRNVRFKHPHAASVLALAIGAICAMPAHAVYTIIDDDLLPTAVIEAREPRAGSTQSVDIAVPFAPKSVALGPMGRKAIERAIAQAGSSARYRVVGRPDAQPSNVFSGDTTITVADARSQALRQYLTRLGVSPDRIILASDNSPNPRKDGANYNSAIQIVSAQGLPTDPTMRPALTASLVPIAVPAAIAAPRPIAPPPPVAAAQALPAPAPTMPVSPAPLSTLPDRDGLARFINDSVRNGTMTPAVAVSLLSQLLSATPKPVAAPTPAAVIPAAPIAAQPAFQPAAEAAPTSLFATPPTLNRRPTWTAEKSLTLRDNIDAWAQKSGWPASQWEASNYYEVTRSLTLEGDFPDVLRQIAEFTKLNICVNKRQRFIRVTDPAVRCDI